MLCNVTIFPTRGTSCKLLDLFLVSNPNDVCDFHQIAVHDMIFLSCCFERSRVATLYKDIRSFRDIDRDGLLRAAASLDWSSVWFMAGVNEKKECFYTMLNFLLDTFVPVRRIRVTEGDRLSSVRNFFDESMELAINERDAANKVWHDNINRVRGERLWIFYFQKRRYADGLGERNYDGFVTVNLDPSLPQRKLYQNLRGLGVVNAPERLQVEMDVERFYNYFLTRPLLNGAGEFAMSKCA
jgi:hypothetical protein